MGLRDSQEVESLVPESKPGSNGQEKIVRMFIPRTKNSVLRSQRYSIVDRFGCTEYSVTEASLLAVERFEGCEWFVVEGQNNFPTERSYRSFLFTGLERCNNLETLVLDHNKIHIITEENFHPDNNVKTLFLENNKMKYLSFAKRLSKIIRLFISNNKINVREISYI